MKGTAKEQMWNAIQAWMAKVENYPGWKEWQHAKLEHTLYFDDPVLPPTKTLSKEFKFSDEIERQHAVVFPYIGLCHTSESLKDCEYYFRRYPFRDLPVSRSDHITNVCEMYFSRFYEFRERLKKHLNGVAAVVPAGTISVGDYIKAFDKLFDAELRARHGIHHHGRFDDIAISRVFVTYAMSINETTDIHWRNEYISAYRKVVNEWVRRVRIRSKLIENFLEIVAELNLSHCQFLSDSDES